MKVIGVVEGTTCVSGGKYIVEATGDELANLENQANAMRQYEPKDTPHPVYFVGKTFPVSEYWRQLQEADKVRDRLISVAASLHGLSETVKNIGIPSLRSNA